MLQRPRRIEADARPERIGDQAEHVPCPPGAVRVGDGLHRRGARREHEIELAGRDLSRDGVAGGQVALRIVGAEADAIALAEPFLREARDHPRDARVEHRGGRVLDDGHAAHPGGGRIRGAAVAIREEQRRRREPNQREAEREALDGVPDLHDGLPSARERAQAHGVEEAVL
jgi:hypothetical protein